MDITLNGKEIKTKTQSVEKKWIWYVAELPAGEKSNISVSISHKKWRGTAEIWSRGEKKAAGSKVVIYTTEKFREQPQPPLPYEAEQFKEYGKVVHLEF